MRALKSHPYLRRILGASIACLWAVGAHGSPGLEALNRFFDEVQTFQSQFAQVVLDENLQVIDDGSGAMWIARPGKFRWNYAAPAAQQIVGDGARVYVYDVDLEQVTVRAQDEVLGDSPAALLAGAAAWRESYTIQDRGRQGKFDWVTLLPKAKDGGFAEMRIGFRAGQLTLIELIDTLGQHTRLSFLEIQENAKVDAAQFQFTPPPGVDVLDETR